jgi:hypothetical protein
MLPISRSAGFGPRHCLLPENLFWGAAAKQTIYRGAEGRGEIVPLILVDSAKITKLFQVHTCSQFYSDWRAIKSMA